MGIKTTTRINQRNPRSFNNRYIIQIFRLRLKKEKCFSISSFPKPWKTNIFEVPTIFFRLISPDNGLLGVITNCCVAPYAIFFNGELYGPLLPKLLLLLSFISSLSFLTKVCKIILGELIFIWTCVHKVVGLTQGIF